MQSPFSRCEPSMNFSPYNIGHTHLIACSLVAYYTSHERCTYLSVIAHNYAEKASTNYSLWIALTSCISLQLKQHEAECKTNFSAKR